MERLYQLKSVVAFIIASAGGAGLVPKAPGTAGSLIALPLIFFTAPWALTTRILLWIGILLAGVWASAVVDQAAETADNQKIVIDEVVGMGIATWTAGQNWITLAVAFVAFRFFDITKLPPVAQLDRWSKKKASEAVASSYGWSGLGVMGDDVLAGIQALAVVWILQWFQVIP
ncbi:MAG: hypothetical protein A2X94_14585 [Bdellovibrionales bacterium GWB1_55_8]|nr:MAG: hypothetical protein A2X94_14585 [Bdellovibrionales bacterium GWB1_55_8]